MPKKNWLFGGLILASLSAVAIVWMIRTLSLPRFVDQACKNTYLDFYSTEPIRILIAFGYKDARPARFVADRYERNWFVERITHMGFGRDPDDLERFSKQISGPDGKPREIELRVIDSSAGPDDEENRKDPFQAWKSKHAERVFFEALGASDAVFYNGHSRDGGGPDFLPPRLTKYLHVDYDWYKENHPGISRMANALRSASSGAGAKIVGLFSCASSGLFKRKITEAKKRVGVISSEKLLYFSDALEQTMLALSELLKQQCQPDFDRALSRGSPQAGTEFSGFFKN